MGLKICSIASGSTGNCIFVSDGEDNILIDAGIASTRIEKCLKILGGSGNVSVLVTHAHYDHISNLNVFCSRNNAKVFCHYACAGAVSAKGTYKAGQLTEFGEGDLIIGDIAVTPFKVKHDVPCVGYTFFHKGKKIGLATDLGHVGNSVLNHLQGSDLVLIESNHDEGLLKVNAKYSPWLKKRILSDSGHLSNTAAAETAVKLAQANVKQFILGHLSLENNYPELAFNTVVGALQESGFVDVGVEVARHDKMSSLFEIC